MLISVVLPTRNEELLIKDTLTQISRYLKNRKVKYEIIVVINGTTDNTLDIVKSVQSNDKSIKIVKSAPGYGTALRKGLKESKGKFIAIYNVDFYDLPLLGLATTDLLGKDMIIGSKRTPWGKDGRPFQRQAVSFMYNTFLRVFLGFKGSDTHGIKLLRSRVAEKIFPKCKLKNGIFDSEFVIKAQREGFKIMDYPVEAYEKRSTRFNKRFLETPADIYALVKALQ